MESKALADVLSRYEWLKIKNVQPCLYAAQVDFTYGERVEDLSTFLFLFLGPELDKRFGREVVVSAKQQGDECVGSLTVTYGLINDVVVAINELRDKANN